MAILEDQLIVEDLGRQGFKALQFKDGFKFGTDSVLLSWFAASFVRNSSKEVKALELGSNTGTVSLLLLARKDNTVIDSLEIMPNEAEVLSRNITLNNLESRMRGFNGDVRNLPYEIKNRQYDIVLFNPPYFNDSHGERAKNKDDSKGSRLEARFEINGGLEEFVGAAASRVVPSSGYVCMVMHGKRLTDAISAYTKFGIKPTHLMSVHAFDDREASIFLLAGKRGTKSSDLKILPPLILNRKDSSTGDIISTDKLIEIYEKEHSDCFI